MTATTTNSKYFEPGEHVVFINANHKLVRSAVVLREYRDDDGEDRVEVRYTVGEYSYICHPQKMRVGRE